MLKKVVIVVMAGSLLIAGVGCSKKEEAKAPVNEQQQQQTQLPEGHPNIDGAGASTGSATPAKPLNGDEVASKVQKALDAKFPGEWKVSGTELSKGEYTENNNYKIAEEVLTVYPGSMVSIFVGEERISSTIKADGKPVLQGYPTPPEVGQTMKDGKILVKDAGTMGSSSYQKVYLPLKAGDKTVAVMTISVAQ